MSHPVTAVEGLRQYLPGFILDLSWQDVENYITQGFVTRHFRIRGRFSSVGYTRAMRNAEEFTISALLNDKIPREGPNTIYGGDAVAILIRGESKLLRREDEMPLTNIPDYSDITFIYNRPSPIQLWQQCQDMLFHVLYDDDFNGDQNPKYHVNEDKSPPQSLEDQSFLHMITKPFKNAVFRQSQFGYSSETVQAMLGLTLAYRAADMFLEAEGTLDEALKVSEQLSNEDLTTHVLFNFIELYLDQGFLEKATEKFVILKSNLFQKKNTELNATKNATAHDRKLSLRLEEEPISDSISHFGIKYSLKLFKQGFSKQAITLVEKLAQNQELLSLELCSSNYHQGDTFSLVTEVVGALLHQNESLLAERLLRSLTEQSQSDPGNPMVLFSMEGLATLLSDQGKYEEEEKMHRDLLQLREEVLGQEHSDTLTSMNNLALTIRNQGKYEEAEMMHREVLRLREKVLGWEHPDTLTSVNNLAMTFSDQGKYEEAESMHREVLQLKEKVLGPEHSDTLTSMANLASTFWNEGRWQEAEELEVQVMEKMQRILGSEHPDTLSSMANLASTFWNEGRWQEAEKLEVQVMEIRKRVLGADHPDTLTSMANLASTYRNQGRWEMAEELDMQVMEMSKKKLGVDHPSTLTSMGNLASTYWNQGRLEAAEELFMQVMETSKKKLGVDHPSTLTSMANLASTYRNQGQWMQAEELDVQVMETRKRVLGLEHPDTLTSMANLASTYWNQGRWTQAEELYVQVMETRKRVLGPEHPDTLTSMNNLAFTWNGQGRCSEAVSLMKECVERQQRVLGFDHPSCISACLVLAQWRAEQK